MRHSNSRGKLRRKQAKLLDPVSLVVKSKLLAPNVKRSLDTYRWNTEFVEGKQLGVGGEGRTFMVTKLDGSTDQVFVLKEIKVQYESKAVLYASNEARYSLSFDHKNLVKSYDAWIQRDEDEKHSFYYILMEYCSKGDISKLKGIEKEQVMKIFIDTLRGLNYLHVDQQMWHRDIKPKNIFCTEDGVYKIGDFGCLAVVKNLMKRFKSIVGTFSFQAPEVAARKPQCEKVDVFSLGMTIAQLMCTEDFEKKFYDFPVRLFMGETTVSEVIDLIPDKYGAGLKHLIGLMINLSPHKRPSCEDILNKFGANDIAWNIWTATDVILRNIKNVVIWIDLSPVPPRRLIKDIQQSCPSYVAIFVAQSVEKVEKFYKHLSAVKREWSFQYTFTYFPAIVGTLRIPMEEIKAKQDEILKSMLILQECNQRRFGSVMIIAPALLGEGNQNFENEIITIKRSALICRENKDIRNLWHFCHMSRILTLCRDVEKTDECTVLMSWCAALDLYYIDRGLYCKRLKSIEGIQDYLSNAIYTFNRIISGAQNSLEMHVAFMDTLRKREDTSHDTSYVPVLLLMQDIQTMRQLPSSVFDSPFVRATTCVVEAKCFGSMAPCSWAINYSEVSTKQKTLNKKWNGMVTVIDVKVFNFQKKEGEKKPSPVSMSIKTNANNEKRAKKIKHIDPSWINLHWNFFCKGIDSLTIELTQPNVKGSATVFITDLLREAPSGNPCSLAKTIPIVVKKDKANCWLTLYVQLKENEEDKQDFLRSSVSSPVVQVQKYDTVTLHEKFLTLATHFLSAKDVALHGLFRYEADLHRIMNMFSEVEQGYECSFEGEDPYNVARVLLRYISMKITSELLIPDEHYTALKESVAKTQEIQIFLLKSLPSASKRWLTVLAPFLNKVNESWLSSGEGDDSFSNLMAPWVIRKQSIDASQAPSLILRMIMKHHDKFETKKT